MHEQTYPTAYNINIYYTLQSRLNIDQHKPRHNYKTRQKHQPHNNIHCHTTQYTSPPLITT